MSLPLTNAVLNVRLPQFDASFQVGRNCSSIEVGAEGLVIREPRTTAGDLCAFNILLAPWGWSKRERREAQQEPARAEVSSLLCTVCGATFQTSQGLGSHMSRKHKT